MKHESDTLIHGEHNRVNGVMNDEEKPEVEKPSFLGQPPPHPPVDDDSIRNITLLKDAASGYGFSLRGSNPVFICSIAVDGAAARAGILEGDQILYIDQQCVENLEHDRVVEFIKRAGTIIHLTVRSANPTSSVPKVAIEGDDGLQLTESGDDPFAPFSELKLLLQRPAHLATFLHYLLSSSDCVIEETFLYLNSTWFQDTPDRQEAHVIFEDYMATKAPMRVLSITQQIFQEMESALNKKREDVSQLSSIFEKITDCLEPHVSATLAKFNDLILNHGLSQFYCAGLLEDLSKAEEPSTVEEILKPHLQSLSQNKEDDRAQVSEYTLLALMDRVGLGGFRSPSNGRAPIRSRSSRRSGRSKPAKKYHLHAGHHFVTTSYQHPTFCGVCKTLLWGFARQGWTCQDCGFHVHKSNDLTGRRKCHKLITQQCDGVKVKKSLFPNKLSSKRGGSTKGKKGDFSRNASTNDPSSLPIPRNGGPNSPTGRRSPIGETSTGSSMRRPRGMTQPETEVNTLMGIELDLPDDPAEDPEYWNETVEEKSVAKKLGKKGVKRQELIYELIQTEKSFTRYLNILQQLFRKTIVNEGLMFADELYGLFANVDEVVEQNAPLLKSLTQLQAENYGRAIPDIGKTFLEGFNQIDPQAYARFCANQTSANILFQEKMKGYSHFRTSMTMCQNHPVAEKLSFTDFLAKPLQRLTKYPLLIKDIRKNTPDSNKQEIKNLDEAYAKTGEFLTCVQDAVRISENTARLKHLFGSMDSSALNPSEEAFFRQLNNENDRQLLHEGKLQIRIQERCYDVQAVVLADMILLLQETREGYALRLPGKKKSPIVLLGSTIARAVATDDKAFYVISTARYGIKNAGPQMYELVAESLKKKKFWVQLITDTAKTFTEENPDWEEKMMQQQLAQEAEAEAAAAAAGNKKTAAVESDSEDEDNLDLQLGELMAQMQDNCDANNKILARVEKILAAEEGAKRETADDTSAGVPTNEEARASFEKRHSVAGRSRDFNRRTSKASSGKALSLPAGVHLANMAAASEDESDDMQQDLVAASQLSRALAELTELKMEMARLKINLFEKGGKMEGDGEEEGIEIEPDQSEISHHEDLAPPVVLEEDGPSLSSEVFATLQQRERVSALSAGSALVIPSATSDADSQEELESFI